MSSTQNTIEADEECTCAHTFEFHPEGGPCTGTGAALDAEYGIPADEKCICPGWNLLK